MRDSRLRKTRFNASRHKGKWDHWSLTVQSRDEETSNPFIVAHGFGWGATIPLPEWCGWWIRPAIRKIIATTWDPATIERLGRNWYEDVTPRRYGISLFQDMLTFYYGKYTPFGGDNKHSKTFFLPWTQWTFVRRSVYGTQGEPLGHLDCWNTTSNHSNDTHVPVVVFSLKDFDGQEIRATTFIEEREWVRGTGSMKWLKYVFKPKIRRSLHISFNKETGPEKGSYKGGTVGTGVDMTGTELHESAIRRYCDDHNMVFVERLPDEYPVK